MRTSSTTESTRSESARTHEPKHGAHAERVPVPKGDIERFRELFAAAERDPHGKEAKTDDALLLRPDTDPAAKHEPRADALSAEAAAIAQAGRAAAATAAPSASTPLPNPSAGLADLIEKHVRRMLVSESASSDGRDARVVLSMGDGALAGTDLVLTRSEEGWMLHADVADEAQAETLKRCAPDLVRRFAEQGLGVIDVEAERR